MVASSRWQQMVALGRWQPMTALGRGRLWSMDVRGRWPFLADGRFLPMAAFGL